MGSGNREGGIFKAFLGQLVDLFSSEAPPPSGESPAAGAAHSAWASAPAGDPGGLSAGPSPNRFDPITQSVDRDLARFQATDVQEHLSFAPGDRYQLAYINLHAEGQEAVALRAAFFRQVRAAARRQWAVDRIKANCPHGVLPDGLLEFRVPPAGADVDDGDAWNDQIAGATIVTTPFRLSLHGNWVPAPTGASAVDGQPSSLDVRHRGIVLVIDDATGRREVPVHSLPLLMGRVAAGTPHAMQGQYLSRRHALLEPDAHGGLVLHNLSANGSLVDGLPLSAGERSGLRNGARIALGRTPDGVAASPSDCPVLQVRWLADGAIDTPTPPVPTADGGPAARDASVTPIWQPASGPLALLAVQDAEGTRTCAVLRLPFTIGREAQADCPLPRANDKVSREHLRVQAVSDAGARIQELSRDGRGGGWGTAVDGVEQPAEFTLPWGATVVLASRDPARPVRVQLRKPGS